LIPICGVGAFVWDGIFIGTTQTRGMLLSAAIAAGVFFVGTAILIGAIGNHGLWLSMMLFLALRGVTQTVWFATRLQKNALSRQ
jgi:MATE family multidrug resistance protein